MRLALFSISSNLLTDTFVYTVLIPLLFLLQCRPTWGFNAPPFRRMSLSSAAPTVQASRGSAWPRGDRLPHRGSHWHSEVASASLRAEFWKLQYIRWKRRHLPPMYTLTEMGLKARELCCQSSVDHQHSRCALNDEDVGVCESIRGLVSPLPEVSKKSRGPLTQCAL